MHRRGLAIQRPTQSHLPRPPVHREQLRRRHDATAASGVVVLEAVADGGAGRRASMADVEQCRDGDVLAEFQSNDVTRKHRRDVIRVDDLHVDL